MKKAGRIIGRLLIMGALLSVPFLFRNSEAGERVGDFLRPALCLVTSQYEPVNALSASAEPSGEAPAEGDVARAPRHAVDANEATWWADGPGPGARLEIALGDPGVNVGRIQILPGEHNEAGGDYLGQPRPRDLTVELLADGRTVGSTQVSLADVHEPQAFVLEEVAEPVTAVALQVHEVYGGQSGDAMAIAEVVVERDACAD